MAKIYLSLSTRVQRDTGKAEVLLRYRNTREIGQRVHSHVFILPKYFVDGEIVIKQRIVTPEVQEAREAKLAMDRIIAHLHEKGDKKAISDLAPDWAQDTVDRLLFPEKYKEPESDERLFSDKTEDFLKYKKVSAQRIKSYRIIFNLVKRFELYSGNPIKLDEATADTLVALGYCFKKCV